MYKDGIRKADKNTLIELQESLTKYVDSIQRLIQTLEDNQGIDDQSKSIAKNSVTTSMETLLEVQKVTHRNIRLLIKDWKVNTPIKPNQFRKKKEKISHMNNFHLRKITNYRMVVCRNSTEPSPPWTSKLLSN